MTAKTSKSESPEKTPQAPTQEAPKGAARKANRRTRATSGAQDRKKARPGPGTEAKKPAGTGADTAAGAPGEAGGPVTLGELKEAYLAHLQQAGKSQGTVFSYGLDLQVAVAHFGEGTQIQTLTPRKVQNFFESDTVTKTRTGKPKAQPTVAKTRRVLRLALSWAADQGLIEKVPVEAERRGRKPKEDPARGVSGRKPGVKGTRREKTEASTAERAESQGTKES